MARIKIAYIGGGSTRAPGTMVSFIHQGQNFLGSEIVLIDLDEERLALVKKLADKMIAVRGLDLRVSVTTRRRDGLRDCDAVLTSYRPGGFEARHLDESIPLKYGVIGQETQGPGGFFMALRSIAVMKEIIADVEAVCPKARVFNYTNPVNIVAEAVTHNSPVWFAAFCEGPLFFGHDFAEWIGLDRTRMDVAMIGLNHGSWSVRHTYDGQDFMPLLEHAYAARCRDTSLPAWKLRLMNLAVTMGALPAHYFQYYYFKEEILSELQAKPTTRAQDIMARVPDYWQHYREQAERDDPQLDPRRSRGGIHELELAIDAMDAIFNDRGEVLPVNVPNRGSISNLPDDRVVETQGYLDRHGITPLAMGPLPPQVLGLVEMLSEYQSLTAQAAWSGTKRDAVRALASNPLVFSLHKAQAIYDEMAAAHARYLPERLLR
ncbi:MAG: glycoside hydrolase [Anaerolineae bacterium]|nr:glycoside hydrolase [Candidatus Roseilinea sp.]MDW8451502.1 glycoside hydrolase [Anaerolineae bacterium]